MKIAIIGVGNMGGAVATGLANQDVKGIELALANPSQGKLLPFKNKPNVAMTTSDNAEAAAWAQVVIIAVKPWLAQEVVAKLAPTLAHKVVVFFTAGITAQQVAEWTANIDDCQTLFVIPNTAAAVQASCSFVSPISASQKAIDDVVDIFNILGTTMIVDEAHLKAGMVLASCGIAYAMRYIRAATVGGVQLGFNARQAQEIVAQTVIGAAALCQQPGAHAEAEIDKVTTPGGFTIRGLNAMEGAGFTNAVIKGLTV